MYDLDWCVCNHFGHSHATPFSDPDSGRTHCLISGCDCEAFKLRDGGTKPTNPKDAVGSDKLPMHLVPQSLNAFAAIGLLNGMLKYGRTNWREAGIRPTIYVDAIIRHLTDWFEGEDFDPDDDVHNLAGAAASLAILIDALVNGQLNDDRQYNPGGGWRKARAMMEPMVKKLKELHAGRDPKHWDIRDMK